MASIFVISENTRKGVSMNYIKLVRRKGVQYTKLVGEGSHGQSGMKTKANKTHKKSWNF